MKEEGARRKEERYRDNAEVGEGRRRMGKNDRGRRKKE